MFLIAEMSLKMVFVHNFLVLGPIKVIFALMVFIATSRIVL
jgi:hypothetical protein